jgi:hypothetical protein
MAASPCSPHQAENATKSLVYARLVFSAREAPAYAAAASASLLGMGFETSSTRRALGAVFGWRRARAVVFFAGFAMGVPRRIT